MKFKCTCNEKGVTLVEVLAVFVISGLVIMTIMSIHIYTQKQFIDQSEQAHNLTDVTIAMKVITKDFRTHDLIEFEADEATVLEFEDGNKYEFKNDILYRNDGPYLYEVADFYVEKDDELADVYYIYIKGKNGKELDTQIAVRKEDRVDENEDETNTE